MYQSPSGARGPDCRSEKRIACNGVLPEDGTDQVLARRLFPDAALFLDGQHCCAMDGLLVQRLAGPKPGGGLKARPTPTACPYTL